MVFETVKKEWTKVLVCVAQGDFDGDQSRPGEGVPAEGAACVIFANVSEEEMLQAGEDKNIGKEESDEAEEDLGVTDQKHR